MSCRGISGEKGAVIKVVKYECQEAECAAELPSHVNFCPFCGMQQMTMKLKQVSASADHPSAGPNLILSNVSSSVVNAAQQEKKAAIEADELISENRLEILHQHIVDETANGYCDCQTFEKLLRDGVKTIGGDKKRISGVVSLELQQLGVVNEFALLKELEELLGTITQLEKKLGKKERTDALQSVCKARFGMSKGLDLEVAEQFITNFCRNNLIKERQGLWGWKVL